jgi:hypothetical protein
LLGILRSAADRDDGHVSLVPECASPLAGADLDCLGLELADEGACGVDVLGSDGVAEAVLDSLRQLDRLRAFLKAPIRSLNSADDQDAVIDLRIQPVNDQLPQRRTRTLQPATPSQLSATRRTKATSPVPRSTRRGRTSAATCK